MTKRTIICILILCFTFGTIPAQQRETAASHIRHGQDHLKNQNYAEAITSFNAALTLNPNRSQQNAANTGLTEARTGRARQLFNQGQNLQNEEKIAEAIELYNSARNIAPQSSDIQRMISQRLNEAQRLLDAQIAHELQTVQAQERAVQDQLARERAEQSMQYVQKANEQFIAGHYSEAKTDYELAITIGGLTDAQAADARRLIAETQDIQAKMEAFARPVEDRDFEVTQNIFGTVTIVKYLGAQTKTVNIGGTNHTITYGILDVKIPDMLRRTKVEIIGDGAFKDMGITSIVFPNTLKEIGISAFAGNRLKTLIIPSTVTKINGGMPQLPVEVSQLGAFEGNTILESIVIPNSVTEIGARAFKDCGLTSVHLGTGVREIGESAFRNNKLPVVTLPPSVRIIHRFAFDSNQITSQTINIGIDVIYNDAFTNNPMTSLILSVPARGNHNWQTLYNIGGIQYPRLGGNHSQYGVNTRVFPDTLERVTLPANMHDSNVSGISESLKNFYTNNVARRTAGIYIKDGGIWSKQ